MFKFFDQSCNDIILKILSYLNPEDLKSIQQVSKKLQKLSLNNLLWQRLFKEYFGFVIKVNDSCHDKFIINYLLDKAIHYSSQEYADSTKASKYFNLVNQKILQLYSIADEDKIWQSFILGYLIVYGYKNTGDIELGIKYLEEAADLGNIKAMYLLVAIFLPELETHRYDDIGHDIDARFPTSELLPNIRTPLYRRPDIEKGVIYLYQMYAKGDYETACLLAKFHLRKEGYEELGIQYNKAEAIRILETSAKNGNIKAIYYLKEMYLKKAKKIYEQSSLSIYNYYYACRQKEEDKSEKDREYESKVEKLRQSLTSEQINISEVISLTDTFAHQGSKSAAGCLYSLYERGSDDFQIEPNPKKAFYYRNILTEIIYQENDELSVLIQKIIYWLEMAGDLGDSEAFLNLGKSYLKGILADEGHIFTTVNIQKGFDYLKRSFSLGSSEAAYTLGCVYSKDHPNNFFDHNDWALGIDINREEGIKWFEKGSKLNNDKHAQNCAVTLATIYRDDQQSNVIPNLEKTLYWYNKAIELGSKDSILLLARLYLKGDYKLELSPNTSEAAKLYEQAFYCEGNADGKVAITIALHYKDANDLAQYIKWNIRGIALGEKYCAFNLKEFFAPPQYGFMEPSRKSKYVVIYKELESIFQNLSINSNDSDHDSIAEHEFSDSDNESISTHKEAEKINLEKLSLLAQNCYEALNLLVIEDDFIINNGQTKSLRNG